MSLTRRVLQSLVNLLAPGELILLNSHKEGSFDAVLTDSKAFPIPEIVAVSRPSTFQYSKVCLAHVHLGVHFPVVGM